MSQSPHGASIELLGLLREMKGADISIPGKRLESGGAFFSSEWPSRSTPCQPSAAKLERHLLRVHREELGLLLKDACLRIFVSDRNLGGVVLLDRVNGEPQMPQDGKDWGRDLVAKREAFPDPDGSEAEMIVMDRLVAGGNANGPSLREVADAGMRLAPSTAFQIYQGYGYESEGALVSASQKLERAYHGASRYMNRIEAACALGSLSSQLGSEGSAIRWYKQASLGIAAYPQAALGWVFFALQAGDTKELRDAGGALEDHLGSDATMLDEYCVRLRTDLFTGRWEPTRESQRIHSQHLRTDYVDRIHRAFR